MMLFSPQKVLHLKDELKKKQPKLHGDYIIRRKLDGWLAYIPYDATTRTWYPIRSSANRVIPAFQWMFDEHVLQKLPKPTESVILIAEATIPDMLFPEMNGVFNRSAGNFSCRDVVFNLHDIVYTDIAYKATERERFLASLDLSNMKQFTKIPVVGVTPYNDYIWQKLFDEAINENDEGIVAKRASGIFMPTKRNADLIKKKLEVEVDCKAIRLEETIGDKGNPSLTLISKRKNGIEIRTVINRHSLQEAWRKEPARIIGEIVTVKGMEIYPDGNIRQPTFYCVRYDKDGEDYE